MNSSDEIKKTEYDWTHLYNLEYKLTEKLVLDAKVVHGFKRGSKSLGIPTANMCMEELGEIGESLSTGIYYGYGILNGAVHLSVISVGWNPFFKNEKKTIEAYLIAEMEDFYDQQLKLIILGYLRDEQSFNSLDELISCIYSDIDLAKKRLTEIPFSSLNIT